jgi:hypothetical protein
MNEWMPQRNTPGRVDTGWRAGLQHADPGLANK